jgi:hypothetical protein
MKASSFASRHPLLSAAIALALAAQLAACGGDDNNTPTPPSGGTPQTPQVPETPQTPTTPETPTTPTTPAKSKLTLKGAVTDEPIANAQVTATIGTESFSATAGADGSYSLDIEIDEANKDQFITLTAKGVGDQSFVEFTSLAGSFNALATQAGDDGTLLSSENFATQITNVSTAQAVFLKEANGGEPITTDAALQSLAGQMNAQDVLDLAAAIKLAVDDAANNPLPEGATSILALASDPTARQEFINEVYTNNPEAFAAAQVAIAQDPDLIQSDDTLQKYLDNEGFTTAMLSTDGLFSFNYLKRVQHFDLLAGGIGYESTDSYNQAFTWALNGSTIEITYNEPVETVSFDTENCNGSVAQQESHYVTAGVKVTLLSARQVAVTTTSDVTHPNCPSLDVSSTKHTSTVARTILSMDNAQVIDVEKLKDNAQTIYVWDPNQQKVVADVAEIYADGTGRALTTGQDFTWEMNADGGADEVGKIFQAEFAGWTAEYLSLRDIDDLASDIFWEIRVGNDGDQGVYMGAGASVFADPEYAVVFTEADVAGRFYQFGKGDETTGDPRLSGFRLRFDEGGIGSEANDYITENDTVGTTNGDNDPTFKFRWNIEEGPVGVEVVVRRTFNVVAETYNCEVGTTDCIVWDERRIIPMVADEARVYWMEIRRNAGVGVVGPDTPQTQLVRFYDHEAFAAPAGMGKLKLTTKGSLSRELLDGAQQR